MRLYRKYLSSEEIKIYRDQGKEFPLNTTHLISIQKKHGGDTFTSGAEPIETRDFKKIFHMLIKEIEMEISKYEIQK